MSPAEATRGSDRRRTAFLVALALGLALRLLFFGRSGTFDVNEWSGWGEAVRQDGLLSAYAGNLYPVQWAIFGGDAALASSLGASFAELLKATNLVFDLANLALLVALLRRWGLASEWALFYWLGPYFLVIDWLGYVDAQMTFFVLVTLAVLPSRPDARRCALAGIPLAVALLMKPQVLILAVVVLAYALMQALWTRRLNERSAAGLALLVPAAVAFGAWSVAFAIDGHALTFLAHTYLHPPRSSQAVAAQMPNIWYPIKALSALDLDTGLVIRAPHYFYALAAIATTGLLLAGLALIVRRTASWPWDLVVLTLFAMAAAVQPIVFASGHENHFFLAAVLVSLLCIRIGSLVGLIAISSALLLQAFNMLALYGVGGPRFSDSQPLGALVDAYGPALLVVIASANVLAVGIAAVAITRSAYVREPPRRGFTTPFDV